MHNYWEILGVTPNASSDEVKKAFIQKAKKLHPDRGGDAQKFIKLQEAYRILSDPHALQKYEEEESEKLVDDPTEYSCALWKNIFKKGD